MKAYKHFFTVSGLLLSLQGLSQAHTRVLFIGNSYTGVNNLPQIVYDVCLSAGDTIQFSSNSPGGTTFQQHVSNTTTEAEIKLGNWDFVVLQEQSQLPSFPINQVQSQCFPYAAMLNDSIEKYNPCAETVFYMTWGRKNGDASNCSSWPPVCTYAGMDSLLHLRYMTMAADNQSIVSPVGAVWNYVRSNFPSINLYQSDESHPSLAGSYLAACTFYTSMLRKNPLLITNDYGLSASDAAAIRSAVKAVVYDNLMDWYIGLYDLNAAFSYSASSSADVTFSNTSVNASTYYWDFGDGDTSAVMNPIHHYSINGNYTVRLIALSTCEADTIEQVVSIQQAALQENNWKSNVNIFPNPSNSYIYIQAGQVKSIQLMSSLGEEVKTELINNENGSVLDIRKISVGIYFLKINFEFYSVTKKIIKQ